MTIPQTSFRAKRNLLITILLNFTITTVEIIGGLISGSLALLSDALHNFADAIAIVISYAALQLSKRPRTEKYTFGLKRAEILAAIINAVTLVVICFFLIKASFERLSRPTPITADIMLVVAVIGLLANVIGAVLVHKISSGNLNLRTAYFHLFSDAVSSLAVILGAVLIMTLQITWIDPVLTILISLYILKEAWSIVKEAVDVIMMASPKEIDITGLVQDLESLAEIKNVHHVHIWKLNDQETYLEAHIQVQDMALSQTAAIKKKIENKIAQYAIHHLTLQFESQGCDFQDHLLKKS